MCVMSAATCSCAFQPVCGIVSATQPHNKQAASVLSIPSRPIAQRKETSMRDPLKRTMPCAWWQDVAVKFAAFCDIIRGEARPHNATIARARNTNDCLTNVPEKEARMARTSIPSHQTCTKCGETLPYTTDYFYKRSGKDYLYRFCRSCHNDMTRPNANQWRKDNPEKAREYQSAYYSNPDNREKIKERSKDWRERNPGKASERVKSWRERNPKKPSVYANTWRKNNPTAERAMKANRHARKRNLPNTLTGAEWQAALDYFNGCCAVCGRQLNDLFGTHTAAADHWIPLASDECPGTVVTNMIPLCHGEGGCNNRKHAKLPEQWLVEQFGKREANAILKRIDAYFAWVSGGAE